MLKKILFLTVIAIISFSCTKQQRKELSGAPNAIGSPNSVLIVMDKNNWDGAIGDSLRYYFEGPFILVPKPEPVFNLSYSELIEFREYRRHVRNIVFVGDLTSTSSGVTKTIANELGKENLLKAKQDPNFGYASIKNKYAEGQRVVYLFGNGEVELAKNIRTKFPAIKKLFNEADKPLIKANAYAGTAKDIVMMREMTEKIGATIDIPGAYRVARQKDNMIWFRYDMEKYGMNIIATVFDYTDETQITPENLLKVRNALGKKHVTSGADNAYMTTETEQLKVFYKQVNLNGYYALEARGVWKMVGDYLGGPFLSYMAYNPDNQKVAFIDGFVLAPGEDTQKEYVQRLEVIMKTLKF